MQWSPDPRLAAWLQKTKSEDAILPAHFQVDELLAGGCGARGLVLSRQ
jgi:hypothetical protein